jgi:hypothetical protein
VSRLSDPPTQDEASNDESAKDTGEEDSRSAASRLSRRTKQVFGAVAALIAILVSATTLFDWLSDKVSDPPPVKPANRGALIESAKVQTRAERQEDFMVATRQSTDRISESELDEKGMVWSVRVRIRGYEGEWFWLQWQMLDAEGEHLDFPWVDTPSWFVPDSQDHWGDALVWVPYPPSTGKHQVRFSLLRSDYSPVTSVVHKVPPRPAGAR